MGPDFLQAVDWNAPWLAPYADAGFQLASTRDWRDGFNRASAAQSLQNFQGLPLRFIPQDELPPGTPYEAHIGKTGLVPTRDNLHDFFNALVWLTFPAIKARLNQLQFEHLNNLASGSGDFKPGGRRGVLRDAATIFDENAALFVAKEESPLVDALRAHRWEDVFLGQRGSFGQDYHVILFGHALLEKLVKPYKAITAHCFYTLCPRLPASAVPQQWLDQEVASRLSPSTSTASFFPLPVLGIPGWWPDQGNDFYADTAVFRPAR